MIVGETGVQSLCDQEGNVGNEVIDAVGENGGIVLVGGADRYLCGGVDNIVRHIEYIVDRIGIDHVGIGGMWQLVNENQSNPFFHVNHFRFNSL